MLNHKLTVCVLTLSHGEHGNISPQTLKRRLSADMYKPARDDWTPFAMERSIMEHIEDAGFKPVPVDILNAADIDKRRVLLQDVKLYIVDPAFLALKRIEGLEQGINNLKNFFHELNGAMADPPKDRYCCVIVPRYLPEKTKEHLEKICRSLLPNIHPEHVAGLRKIGWSIESDFKLEGFLELLRDEFLREPWRGGVSLDSAARIFDSKGTPDLNLPATPRMREQERGAK